MSKGKKKVNEHHHTHSPEVVVDDAVIIQIAKLDLHMGDTIWVKVAETVPFAKDWEALHMMQHGLQEVIDHQYPDLNLLVLVAPGDAEPVIIRPVEDPVEEPVKEGVTEP